MKLTKLRKIVGKLYRRESELKGTKYEKIFSMRKEKRQQMGVHALRIWVDMAEEALRLHRETATKNTLDHWIQSR